MLIISAPSAPELVQISTTLFKNELNVTVQPGIIAGDKYILIVIDLDTEEKLVTGQQYDTASGPSYVVRVTLTPGHKYQAMVKSRSGGQSSTHTESNTLGIRKYTGRTQYNDSCVYFFHQYKTYWISDYLWDPNIV